MFEYINEKGDSYEYDNDSKILAKHAGLDSVVAGQLIEAKLDMVLGNDVTSPVAINEMTKFDKNSVLTGLRFLLLWTILLLTRIFNLRKTASRLENLPKV